ncbi:inhibin beta A chain [Petaurus breviceps papuanus]|uniref:inhibin beta A chain n=1 Tax=Petaurus breviceps papuanus TaxID=3040969 RepID=UPI0036D84076
MPGLSLRGFLLALCWIRVRSSPTPGSEGASPGPVPECPSCALSSLPKEIPSSQPEMVEAVKKHILNMLHLKKRPDVSQPVPKAALLNAIKKLHVGKVGENGYVEIEDDIGRRAEMNELLEQTSEIITFAESGGCLPLRPRGSPPASHCTCDECPPLVSGTPGLGRQADRQG